MRRTCSSLKLLIKLCISLAVGLLSSNEVLFLLKRLILGLSKTWSAFAYDWTGFDKLKILSLWCAFAAPAASPPGVEPTERFVYSMDDVYKLFIWAEACCCLAEVFATARPPALVLACLASFFGRPAFKACERRSSYNSWVGAVMIEVIAFLPWPLFLRRFSW